jgi:hemerythrin-like domain-containing protein
MSGARFGKKLVEEAEGSQEMNITAETHVHELIDAYPYMMDWLVGRADEFKKLKNPVLFNTVGRAARLKEAAAMADIPLEQFLDEVRREIAIHEISAEESAVAAPSDADPEVRAQRQEKLKEIIRKLHEGASVEQVKAEFDALTTGIDSAEIARMEQSLIAEGMPVSEVQRLCDVHVSVFKEALEEKPSASVAAGHPIDSYRRENAVIAELTGELREALPSLESGGEAAAERVAATLEKLAQIETHYLRKEHQLFPVLERHDVEGPTKVMWGLDDDIRGRIKTARALAAGGDAHGLAVTLPELLTMVDDMVYKEEKILLPTAQQVISDEEWSDIAHGDAEIGYAWIEGPEGAAAKAAAAAGAPSVADAAAASGET